MGNVILPTGSSVYVNELKGSVNLSELISDMRNEDYTSTYRVTVISAIGKLEKNAAPAMPYLREMADRVRVGNDYLLCEAASQAIKKIEASGVTDTNTYEDNRYTSKTYVKKPDINKVVFSEINSPSLSDGAKVYGRCTFCTKLEVITSHAKEFSEAIAGERYHCNFCLRNNYHRKGSNIMMLTYRGIFGYYYYSYYIHPKSATMNLGELQDIIELHVRVGLQNPLFRYDPDSYVWFVDFDNIKGKVTTDQVLKTIIQHIFCFNLYDNVKGCSPLKLYEKYKRAVGEFAQHHVRADGEKVFSPTLLDCDIPTVCPAGGRFVPVEILHNFTPMNMLDHNKRSSRHF